MNDSLYPNPRLYVEIVVLSFEGPDLYSLVGGLGVRVAEMTQVMAQMGYDTRLFFIGDPDLPDYEIKGARLHFHRWSRWLSKQYPEGVYHGEIAKVEDYRKSVPEFLVDKVVAPNAQIGKLTVVLGEDWQTAGTMIRISDMLKAKELSEHALLFWNANNVFGFEAINFPALQEASQLLTVSRYMKERMRALKLSSQVVVNGIPPRFWSPVDTDFGVRIRELFGKTLLSKIGRYHSDKRWLMAIDALTHCKKIGLSTILLVRGGREEYGKTVRQRALDAGLVWERISPLSNDNDTIFSALAQCKDADVIELDFFVPEAFLRVLFWASDAVLANSVHEPFGLVGLEVMACGGVAITGSTGEEYLHNFHNGIALSSDDPREIAVYLTELKDNPALAEEFRHQGQETAKRYDWSSVVRDFLRKVELRAWSKGITLQKQDQTHESDI